ncbi:hypothetical protein [Stutzerimonas zhaodongensis]
MNTFFRNLELPTAKVIASEMDRNGSFCISNFLSSEQLQSLKQTVRAEGDKHKGCYFAHHGGPEIEQSQLGAISASPEFRALLKNVYQSGAGAAAYNSEILNVLRCVQGSSGRRESNCFHFDASLVTALLPIEIPQDGVDRGDLILFPNLRRIRSNVLINVLEKALLQNPLSRKLISAGIRHRILQPEKLRLVPGNLYLFWGYRTLHANEPCDPAQRRASAIFHYGDPHAGSFVTRMILKLNQRRARRATALGTQPTG